MTNQVDGVAARPHIWRFFRAGGIDQVELTSKDDLAALPSLDPKLWVALGCPTQGLEFDPKTLALLDTDGDGRIRVPEILEAVRWTLKRLKDHSTLLRGEESLPLDAIDDGSEEGRSVLASARRLLAGLGKEGARSITPADTADTARLFSQTRINGDGIVPPDSASDEASRKVLEEIVLCLGGERDLSGKPGVGRAMADAFFEECREFDSWAAVPLTDASSGILPLGDQTARAHAALQAVRAKVDDYFVRCRMAAFDPDSTAALETRSATLAPAAGKLLTAEMVELRSLPAAKVAPAGRLPLGAGANPAWERALSELSSIAAPLLGAGRTELSEGDWEKLKASFAPYESWLSSKKGALVERLGAGRVKELLAGGSRKAVESLIAEDSAARGEFEAIEAVDRLVRYHRDLLRLLNNFVSFTEFYGRKSPAVFQAGRLFIDGRCCDLCMRVADMGKHSSLASASRTFLLYCECTRKDVPAKMIIAAALTGGDSDHIFVGRNGVFYDRQGRDWDATIVKVIEHPISIAQAVWSPYKRLVRFIGEQIEKFASARDKAVVEGAGAGIEAQAKSVAAGGAGDKAAPFDVAKFAGIFAAIGLAIGGIAAGLGKLVEAFAALLWWQKPLALLGLMLAVSGPSAVIAWLKLRQRNLGPLLDANGWAINGRVKINIPFGNAVTSTPKLPADAVRRLTDPYAQDDRGPLLKAGAALLFLAAAAAGFWLLTHPEALSQILGKLRCG